MYYAFTTLSTVGFGDFYPKSDNERIFCAIILVGGVMIFSYIMGNFITMINSYKSMNGDFDEYEKLSKFFGLMKEFNKGKDIDKNFKAKIEEYFTYRWKKDRL